MKLWRYVIVHDGGSAPNYDPPFTTLAICKPRIRAGACPGDMVLALAGRRLSDDPHRAVWAGIVAEKLTFEQYWRDPRFAAKRADVTAIADNIYRPGPEGLVQVDNAVHEQRHVKTDLSGRFVLVLEPAWHLDERVSSLPEQFVDLRLGPTNRRGHRVSDLTDAVAGELAAWCASRATERPVASRARRRW